MIRSPLNKLAILAGAMSMLLGAIVLVGWYTHNVTLIQINAAFVPMQYNTALGFLLSGMALLLLTLDRDRMAGIPGLAVLLIGGITLIEYIGGVIWVLISFSWSIMSQSRLLIPAAWLPTQRFVSR
jgi:hypothetical protein